MSNFMSNTINAIFFSLVILSSPSLAIEKLKAGDVVRSACEKNPIFSKPSAFSIPSGNLSFGDKVTIVGLEGQFELPDSDYSSKKALERKERNAAGENSTPKAVKKEDYVRFTFAKISESKFISTSCLVSEKNFAEQTIERSEEKVAALSSGKAKRNFSEDEDEGDLRAVRGAAGGAKGGKADYELADSLISQSQDVYSYQLLMDFRKAGGLGEFK